MRDVIWPALCALAGSGAAWPARCCARVLRAKLTVPISHQRAHLSLMEMDTQLRVSSQSCFLSSQQWPLTRADHGQLLDLETWPQHESPVAQREADLRCPDSCSQRPDPLGLWGDGSWAACPLPCSHLSLLSFPPPVGLGCSSKMPLGSARACLPVCPFLPSFQAVNRVACVVFARCHL